MCQTVDKILIRSTAPSEIRSVLLVCNVLLFGGSRQGNKMEPHRGKKSVGGTELI